jgi:hypothetical protein
MNPGGEDIPSVAVSSNEKLRMFYFSSSTITVGKIKEMEEKGYFAKDDARALDAEIMPEPKH